MIHQTSIRRLLILAAGFVFLVNGIGYSIVPPRLGSGVSLSLTQSELDVLGPPGPVPRRFIVRDEDGSERIRIEGIYPVPVLIGEYSNTTGTYASEEFQALLFDGPNPTGTMKEFYDRNSYGLLDLQGTVYGWYTVPETRAYYEGDDNGGGTDYPTNAGGFVYDLVDASDAEVDYSLYDNDGPDGIPNSGDDDGYVDAFFAVHTGNGGECGGPSIWSHRSSISRKGGPSGGYVTNDPAAAGGFIHVNDYIIMPEMNCDETDLIEIGVFCHEFGHSLGLPDLYDYDGSSEGIGGWGLMGSGSWGGNQNQPELPTHMCAWSKEQLGWLTPIELSSNTGLVSLPQVEDLPIAVKSWRDGDYTGVEYFLIENRQQVGFDQSLITPGILIWHIDNSRPNNNDEDHKKVDLEEADGANGLDNSGNRGDAGDPWPGATWNRVFDWYSQPNSDSYYGFRTEVSVVDIGDPDSLMDVRFTVRSAIIDSMAWGFDDSGGDNDGVWDVGETIELDILVRNDSQTPADSLWAFISSEDTTIQYQVDSVYLGTLEGLSEIGNAGDPFILSTIPEADVHRTALTLTLSGAEHFVWETSWELMIGHPDVIVVDDSEEGSDNLIYYTATLDTLVVPFVTRKVATQGSPADSLEPFELVIWFTGKEEENILDSTDLAALEDHLGRGGRLLLTGQNIAEDLHNRGEAFLTDVLRTDWGGTNPLPFAYGLRGDPVTDSVIVIVSAGTNGANNQNSRDILLPRSGSHTIAVYDTTTLDEAAGLRIESTQDGSKLIFLGFGFEAVNRPSVIEDHVTRVEFMRRMLDWLMKPVGIEDNEPEYAGLPRVLGLGQNYPNPFNPNTTISFDVPVSDQRQQTKLVIYNLRGSRVRTLLDRKMAPGRYEVTWDGKDDRGAGVSSGVYFYRLTSGEKSITRKMLIFK
ncbi:MAG: M6 family metalloprotease domain-containing protein [Candidatus Glassbacteria bacterium]